MAMLLLTATLLGICAQPLYREVDSLDWMAAAAESVVRGRITGYVAEPQPGHDHRFVLTLDVEETLKGKHDTPRRAVLEIEGDTLKRWKDGKVDLLLFLPSVGWGQGVVELEGKDRPEVFSADYRVLRDRAEVLRHAKESIGRAAVGAMKSHRLLLLPGLVQGTRWFSYCETSGGIDLVVPVDERLEKRALEWVKPGLDRDLHNERIRREDAVQALSHFKTESNIAVLRALLDDSDAAPGERRNERGDVEKYTVYPIRDEARKVLEKWGVQIPK